MHALGVLAGLALQALHGVFTHPRQTGGLSNAAAFRQMMQDGLGTFLGHPAVFQRRVAPFRKVCATRAALQQTNGLILTVGLMHAEVARAALAKVGARLVQTTKAFQRLHVLTPPAQAVYPTAYCGWLQSSNANRTPGTICG